MVVRTAFHDIYFISITNLLLLILVFEALADGCLADDVKDPVSLDFRSLRLSLFTHELFIDKTLCGAESLKHGNLLLKLFIHVTLTRS